MAAPMWRGIPCSISELRLDTTLSCGQSFRWKETSAGIWTGVMRNKVWKFKQNENQLLYEVFENNSSSKKSPSSEETVSRDTPDFPIKKESFEVTADCRLLSENSSSQQKTVSSKEFSYFDKNIKDYFQLDVNLSKLYKQWSKADSNFQKTASTFEGIRMLRQEPVENLFSFICSSNNNISRISTMVERMAERFGTFIAVVDGKHYYSFPTIESLSKDHVEDTLRSLGFGYRAKFIHKTAAHICEHHNEEWLNCLRAVPYQEAKKELMKLCGVGAKVADCVCLMSLDKTSAVPVDTHVWQIAARDYIPKLKQSKSLTDSLYNEIGDCFRNIWGEYAGWAHSVLFTADLKQFKDVTKTKKERGKRKSNLILKQESAKKKS